MRLQVLSDLHLESEAFDPQPLPGADLLVLAGDIDSRWAAYDRFAGWPCPVIAVPGNHEYDDRDIDEATPALRAHCAARGIRLLERESMVIGGVRFVGTVRWCDFDLFGAAKRPRAMKAGAYFMNVQRSRRGGAPFDPEAVRAEALACRAWLAAELARPPAGRWERTVVITHFAPSLKSADPRYGAQNGTASFCNADDELLPFADLWIHGHVHCRHDYEVPHPEGRTRVLCQARGLLAKGETVGFDARKPVEV